MEKKWTDKQMENFQDKNNKKWNEVLRSKYILNLSHDQQVTKLKNKHKKEFNILYKAILDLNKTIKILKKQEEFLNELLDKREEIIRTRPSA